MTTSLNVTDGQGSKFEDRGEIVTITFAAGAGDASTTVTGKPWVTSSSRFIATLVGTSSRSIEEALIEGIRVGVDDVVEGVGYTVFAHAPSGASGAFTVHVVGV